jgi:putative transposase
MCRHDGHRISQATVLRLLLEANYQRERRQLAARRWTSRQLETTAGGTWRLAGCRDYWSKYELGWHVAPTANSHDAIVAVELALIEAEHLAGRPLIDLADRDEQGSVVPRVTIVTDNGGPFRSFRFEAGVPPACGGSSPPTPSCATSVPG